MNEELIRQRLKNAIADYAAYLEKKIKDDLRKFDKTLYADIYTPERIINLNNGTIEMRALGMDLLQLMDRTEPDKDTLIGFQAKTLKQIKDKNINFKLALDKYNAVTELANTLASQKTATEQVEDFRNRFSFHRSTIEKRRDSGSVTFLKAVASVFASLTIVGAFFVPSIWKIRGKELNKEVVNILSPAPQNKPSRQAK